MIGLLELGVIAETHLDELPKLWSVFIGDMNVVGP